MPWFEGQKHSSHAGIMLSNTLDLWALLAADLDVNLGKEKALSLSRGGVHGFDPHHPLFFYNTPNPIVLFSKGSFNSYPSLMFPYTEGYSLLLPFLSMPAFCDEPHEIDDSTASGSFVQQTTLN